MHAHEQCMMPQTEEYLQQAEHGEAEMGGSSDDEKRQLQDLELIKEAAKQKLEVLKETTVDTAKELKQVQRKTHDRKCSETKSAYFRCAQQCLISERKI